MDSEKVNRLLELQRRVDEMNRLTEVLRVLRTEATNVDPSNDDSRTATTLVLLTTTVDVIKKYKKEYPEDEYKKTFCKQVQDHFNDPLYVLECAVLGSKKYRRYYDKIFGTRITVPPPLEEVITPTKKKPKRTCNIL